MRDDKRVQLRVSVAEADETWRRFGSVYMRRWQHRRRDEAFHGGSESENEQPMRSDVACRPSDAVSHARPNDTLEDRRLTDRPTVC